MEITHVLQLVTIFITLFLGIASYWQTKKIQHGQNIIAVTTKYRSERCEQLKEAGSAFLTNTSPTLLRLEKDVCPMLKEATYAYEKMCMIMHRYFDPDRELLGLSEEILEISVKYVDGYDEEVLNRLLYLHEKFKLKCDIYFVADWNRIKQETMGEDSSSQAWEDYYKKIELGFKDDFEKIKIKYNQKD